MNLKVLDKFPKIKIIPTVKKNGSINDNINYFKSLLKKKNTKNQSEILKKSFNYFLFNTFKKIGSFTSNKSLVKNKTYLNMVSLYNLKAKNISNDLEEKKLKKSATVQSIREYIINNYISGTSLFDIQKGKHDFYKGMNGIELIKKAKLKMLNNKLSNQKNKNFKYSNDIEDIDIINSYNNHHIKKTKENGLLLANSLKNIDSKAYEEIKRDKYGNPVSKTPQMINMNNLNRIIKVHLINKRLYDIQNDVLLDHNVGKLKNLIYNDEQNILKNKFSIRGLNNKFKSTTNSKFKNLSGINFGLPV